MKIFNLLIVGFSTVFCSSLTTAASLTPSNTIIISDLDDVLIKKSLFLSGISQLKLLTGDYKRSKIKIEDKLNDTKSGTVNGLTFHLLYHGMRRSYLAPHTSWMLDIIEKSRRYIDGTEKIYRYLHDKKSYTFVFATNKDRISYDITAEQFGPSFTSLASKVFVAHPGNSSDLIAQLQTFASVPTTPTSYKDLLHKSLTIQPTEHILHAPTRKPNLLYYHYVEENLDSNKNMIFIDDKLENAKGFNALQSSSPHKRIGIVFKNAAQLAQDFVDLAILSEVDDQKLLEDVRYPGIWGKFKLLGKKLFSPQHIKHTA